MRARYRRRTDGYESHPRVSAFARCPSPMSKVVAVSGRHLMAARVSPTSISMPIVPPVASVLSALTPPPAVPSTVEVHLNDSCLSHESGHETCAVGSLAMPIADLARLLRSMEPMQRRGEFVFVSAPTLPADVVIEASVRESEGISYVLARESADRLGLAYEYVAAWITLTVHSALHAVGLTAAVSTALAQDGISCNVVAGLHHDHLLVPFELADAAMRSLRELADV